MTQEEILQYNKRCVELVHWNKTHPKIKDWHIYITPIGCVSYDKMLFHSDWNWIMEVVDAIKEKTKIKTIDECSEDEWYATIGVTRLTITSKKEAVVEAINQFLIWYEQNKTIKKQNHDSVQLQ